MKKSHFTTPRTMEEGVWHPWGAAIEKPYKGESLGLLDYLLFALSAVIFSAAVWLFFILVGAA